MAAFWIAGLALSTFLTGAFANIATLGAFLAGGILLLGGEVLRARSWVALAWLCALAAGASIDTRTGALSIERTEIRVQARVLRVFHRTSHRDLIIKVVRDTKPRNKTALLRDTQLSLRAPEHIGIIAPGALIEIEGELRPFRRFRNFVAGFPETPARKTLGRTVMKPRHQFKILDEPILRTHFEALRQTVRTHLESKLNAQSAALARALVLGEAYALPRETRDNVRTSGLAHLLAVSGLHVALSAGFIAQFLLWFFSKRITIVCPQRWASALSIPCVFAYACFVGATPSALRAATTFALAALIESLGRKARATEILGFAILLLTLGDPALALNPSFVLSIAATLAIVTGTQRNQQHSLLGQTMRMTLRATLATTPFVLWYFGSFAPAALLTNLAAIPLATGFLIPLAQLHAFLSLVSEGLSELSAPIVEWVIKGFVAFASLSSDLLALDAPPPLSIPELTAIALVCFGYMILHTWRRRLGLLLVASIILLFPEVNLPSYQYHKGLRISCLDVGQGDATLIEWPDQKITLIDAGGLYPDPGKAIAQHLRRLEKHQIEQVVITHPDLDHYQGLKHLAQNFPILELWTTRQAEEETATGDYATLLAVLRAQGTLIRYPEELCNVEHVHGNASLEVLWPCPAYDPTLEPNDNSIVIRIHYRGWHGLWTGDIEREAEAALLEQGSPHAEFLKVAHHGSDTSSSADFIESVAPLHALISVGAENRFGHPRASVLQTLKRHQIKTYRSDRDGMLRITWNEHGPVFETWRERQP